MSMEKKKAEILIVDDITENLRFLSSILLKNGYTVRAAINGPLAVSSAKASVPDLILLDIKMPGMDGYEVCRQLKQIPETQHIPVIFISALGELEDKVTALNVGGVDYITKPFQLEEVLARVDTHLHLRFLQKQMERLNIELSQQVMELNHRNDELDAFAHTVAHDLKNPLSVLSMQVGLLEEQWKQLDGIHVEKMLRGMGRSIEKINSIIEGLLLLASVRKGKVRLKPVEIGTIIEEVQKRQEHLIQKYGARLVCPGKTEWPKIQGHPQWIEEVFANYISNGIKYGGSPPVLDLGFEIREQEFCFFVKDNGKGLSGEDIERIFKPFEQLDHVRPRGHGLGLSVVQRIVRKLGGTVGVDSTVGSGSRFWFTLPKS